MKSLYSTLFAAATIVSAAVSAAPAFAQQTAAPAAAVGTCEIEQGKPQVPLAKMIDWVADWVRRGMPSLGKETHFSTRDGKY